MSRRCRSGRLGIAKARSRRCSIESSFVLVNIKLFKRCRLVPQPFEQAADFGRLSGIDVKGDGDLRVAGERRAGQVRTTCDERRMVSVLKEKELWVKEPATLLLGYSEIAILIELSQHVRMGYCHRNAHDCFDCWSCVSKYSIESAARGGPCGNQLDLVIPGACRDKSINVCKKLVWR